MSITPRVNLVPISFLDPSDPSSLPIFEALNTRYHIIQGVDFIPLSVHDNKVLTINDKKEVRKRIDPSKVGNDIEEYRENKENLLKIAALREEFKSIDEDEEEIDERFQIQKRISGDLGNIIPYGKNTSIFFRNLESKINNNIGRCDSKIINKSLSFMLTWNDISVGGLPIGSPTNIASVIFILLKENGPLTTTIREIDENLKTENFLNIWFII